MLPDGYQCFADCRCEVAEGPRWNEKEQSLYWVDIPRGTVYRKHFPNGIVESFSPAVGKIGAFCFRNDELLLFASQCKVWECAFNGDPQLFAELPGYPDSRFNDVFDDGHGHIFCGAAWVPDLNLPGELWRFDPEEKQFSPVERNLAGMPNGMALSPDRRTFYFAVSEEYRIYSYDYDMKNGVLSNRKCFAEFPCSGGTPDGIACDEHGNLAVALWGGDALCHFSPDGKLQKTEHFSMSLVTSVTYSAFGCFVTTGNRPWQDQAYREQGAGCVYFCPSEDWQTGTEKGRM